MKNKFIFLMLLTLAILFLQNCKESAITNTEKDIYSDDIADITFLNNSFYSTNYDLSYNSGSQVALLRFEKNEEEVFLVDNFNLGLNGQRYLAITNDGENLFLQSRSSYIIFKYSVLGERIYFNTDSLSTFWQPSGICFLEEKDSLLLLYRNINSPKQYRARIVDKAHPQNNSMDKTFSFGFIDTLNSGIYAIDDFNSSLFMLGVDTINNDLLIRTDYNFEVTSIDTIQDSTVVGLCFESNNLYLSYADKRIERWGTY
ncbi:MAG: hypothetical protein ABFS12_14225 [Bacteroidota bacterium]